MRITKVQPKEEVKEGEAEAEDATYVVELIGKMEDKFRLNKAVKELSDSVLSFAIDDVE